VTRAEAYRRTLYRAGEIRVHIGRRNPTADQWMARHGAREAGFITAWNPMSRPMPPAWNAAAQARLIRALREVPMARGDGVLGAWREEMWLAALPWRALLRIARRHRQAAIVGLRHGRPARLLFTRA
jgi:peptidoglycan/xylan/chitin deacetylase (PgdA/CDA1 family)